MKTLTAILLLIVISAQGLAQDEFVGPPSPPPAYPDETPDDLYPFAAYWELTMVRQHEMIDIPYEFKTRVTCMADGIKRILQEDEAAKFLPDDVKWLGFVCEYVEL